MKKILFLGLAFLLLANFTGCICGPGYMPGFYNHSAYNGYSYNPHPGIPGGGMDDCGDCGSCGDCGGCVAAGPSVCGPHQVSGCNSCFPVAGAVARGVLWTPISAIHHLFNFGYYPYGGCGPVYMGECDKACSPCDADGNYVGGPCGVGCSPNPAMDTCAVNYLGGPYNSRLCGGSSSIFSDKYVPGMADTQMHYQFRSEPCAPFFGFGWSYGYSQAPARYTATQSGGCCGSGNVQHGEVYEEYEEYIEEAPRTVSRTQVNPAAKRTTAAPKNLVASNPGNAAGIAVRPLSSAPKTVAPNAINSGNNVNVVASASNVNNNGNIRQTAAQRQLQGGSANNIRTAQGTLSRKPSPEAIASLEEEELPPQKQVITSGGVKKVQR